MDKIRQLLMIKWNQRRKISKKLEGLILPHIIKKLNERSRDLNLEVIECSEELGEVCVLGGNGFRFVINLNDKTCTCREWQVSGIPCIHAIAFITSTNTPLESYVDLYYSVVKFRAAYVQLIPALPDKKLWPKSDPRFKGCTKSKGSNTKGKHKCPICKEFGHHWHNCKKGDPIDIEAMKAVRGPPKKRKSTKASTESSIVPCEDDTNATSMTFPSSQSIGTTIKKKRKCDTPTTGRSIRSITSSNQPGTSSTQADAPNMSLAQLKLRSFKLSIICLLQPNLDARNKPRSM